MPPAGRRRGRRGKLRPTEFIDRQIEREAGLDGEQSEEKAGGFFFILLAVYGAECLSIAIFQWESWTPHSWLEVTLVPLAILFYVLTRRRRVTAGLLCGVVLARILHGFPETANHAYLLMLLFGLFALFDIRNPAERAWLLGTCKWILIVVLFYSGLQKLLYGYYSQGEYFAYAIARYEHFRDFFSLVLPSSEIERLASLQLRPGQGPFRLHSSTGILLSRGAYTAELVLPFFLLYRGTRVAGVIGAILMIALIEAAAREFSFGLQFVNLTLLFVPGALNARLKWGFAAAGASMILVRILGMAGLMPEVYFL